MLIDWKLSWTNPLLDCRGLGAHGTRDGDKFGDSLGFPSTQHHLPPNPSSRGGGGSRAARSQHSPLRPRASADPRREPAVPALLRRAPPAGCLPLAPPQRRACQHCRCRHRAEPGWLTGQGSGKTGVLCNALVLFEIWDHFFVDPAKMVRITFGDQADWLESGHLINMG